MKDSPELKSIKQDINELRNLISEFALGTDKFKDNPQAANEEHRRRFRANPFNCGRPYFPLFIGSGKWIEITEGEATK